MTDNYQPHRATAERAAVAAGRLLIDRQGRVVAREKQPGDLVTEADLASQQLIAAMILADYAEHTILGEEEGLVADPANHWRWIVDPLDGTINFCPRLPVLGRLDRTRTCRRTRRWRRPQSSHGPDLQRESRGRGHPRRSADPSFDDPGSAVEFDLDRIPDNLRC